MIFLACAACIDRVKRRMLTTYGAAGCTGQPVVADALRSDLPIVPAERDAAPRAGAAGGVTAPPVVSGAGRLDDRAIEAALGRAPADRSHLVCGPQLWVDAIARGLLARGAGTRRIHHEAFVCR